MNSRIAISMTRSDLNPVATLLAATLGLTLIEHPTHATSDDYDYLLLITPDYIGLQSLVNPKMKPFYIDFGSQKTENRRQQAGLRKEALARALGVKPKDHPLIIDATAGIGRDSFILASLGFDLIAIERSPILYTLLKDALFRAANIQSLAPIAARIHLIHADSYDWIKNNSASVKPDVIYLDPMFSERKKQAAVKKEMAILQNLLGVDENAAQLLRLALTCSHHRVVVKRHRLAPALINPNERSPDFAIIGKSSRFDIYQMVR